MSESTYEERQSTHTKQATRLAEAPKSNDRNRPKFATKPVPVRMVNHEQYNGDSRIWKVAFGAGRAHGVYPDMSLTFPDVKDSFRIVEATEDTCWILVQDTLDFVLKHRNGVVQPAQNNKLPIPKKR